MRKEIILFLISIFFISCFSGLAKLANAKISDYVGGELTAKVVYSKFNPYAGVPYYEKYGGDVSLELTFKPAGIYAGAGFLSDFGSLDADSDGRFSEVFILKVGWRNFTVLDGIQFARLDIGITKWDLPASEFCDWEAESDIVLIHAEMEDLLWHSSKVHFISSLLGVEAVIPIIKDTEDLEGLNVSGAMIYHIKPAKQFSIFQKVGLGCDNGSFGYASAWILFYEIFGEFECQFLTVRAPIIQAEYVSSQDENRYDYKREQNFYSFGLETVWKF